MKTHNLDKIVSEMMHSVVLSQTDTPLIHMVTKIKPNKYLSIKKLISNNYEERISGITY